MARQGPRRGCACRAASTPQKSVRQARLPAPPFPSKRPSFSLATRNTSQTPSTRLSAPLFLDLLVLRSTTSPRDASRSKLGCRALCRFRFQIRLHFSSSPTPSSLASPFSLTLRALHCSQLSIHSDVLRHEDRISISSILRASRTLCLILLQNV